MGGEAWEEVDAGVCVYACECRGVVCGAGDGDGRGWGVGDEGVLGDKCRCTMSLSLPCGLIWFHLGTWVKIADSALQIMGLGHALATVTLFNCFVKWFIGGLRPHFLDVCKPNIPSSLPTPSAVAPVM